MAGKGWTTQVAAAAGAAAATSAAQLGLGYGLGVIDWPASVTADDSVWLGSLSWVTWIAASATVLGAVLAARLGTGRPDGPWRFALAAAAAIGTLLTVPLIALPARFAVRGDTFAPEAVAGGYAIIGLLVGLAVAYWAVVSRPVAANLLATAAWLWILATAATVVEVSAGRPAATYLTSWQFAGRGSPAGTIHWPSALFTLLAALLIGLVATWPAVRRGDLGIGAAASGAVGPLLVAVAFLLLAPQLTDASGALESAYLIAPYAVLAGLAGSAGAVATGRRAEEIRATRRALLHRRSPRATGVAVVQSGEPAGTGAPDGHRVGHAATDQGGDVLAAHDPAGGTRAGGAKAGGAEAGGAEAGGARAGGARAGGAEAGGAAPIGVATSGAGPGGASASGAGNGDTGIGTDRDASVGGSIGAGSDTYGSGHAGPHGTIRDDSDSDRTVQDGIGARGHASGSAGQESYGSVGHGGGGTDDDPDATAEQPLIGVRGTGATGDSAGTTGDFAGARAVEPVKKPGLLDRLRGSHASHAPDTPVFPVAMPAADRPHDQVVTPTPLQPPPVAPEPLTSPPVAPAPVSHPGFMAPATPAPNSAAQNLFPPATPAPSSDAPSFMAPATPAPGSAAPSFTPPAPSSEASGFTASSAPAPPAPAPGLTAPALPRPVAPAAPGPHSASPVMPEPATPAPRPGFTTPATAGDTPRPRSTVAAPPSSPPIAVINTERRTGPATGDPDATTNATPRIRTAEVSDPTGRDPAAPVAETTTPGRAARTTPPPGRTPAPRPARRSSPAGRTGDDPATP